MSDIVSILPKNASKLELAVESVTGKIEAFQTQTKIADLWNPQTCPEAFLPWLAWTLHVDNWDDKSLSLEQKREMIKASYGVHTIKGTVGAVRKALAPLKYDMKIVEWFEEKKKPYTFRIAVDVNGKKIDTAIFTQIQSIVEETKNIRSHLTGIELIASTTCPFYVGGMSVVVDDVVTVYPVYENKKYINKGKAAGGGSYYLYEKIILEEVKK